VNRVYNATAHKQAWFLRAGNFASVYEYDPANDGPECETITRILAHQPFYKPGAEQHLLRASINVNTAARVLFQREYAELGDFDKCAAHSLTAQALARLYDKGLM
jgi:hypothetical protein